MLITYEIRKYSDIGEFIFKYEPKTEKENAPEYRK